MHKSENRNKEQLHPMHKIVEDMYKAYPVKRMALIVATCSAVSLSILATSLPAMAAPSPISLVKSGYWYADEDIRGFCRIC
ncbi:hypothetical protein N9N97_02880 [Rickettsiaceae bacterium]|nr:hypothetical protein [Rickettsiaceae bacterium]